MLSAVHPSGASSSLSNNDCAPSQTLYADAALNELPIIDINRTLAAKLCGRLNDVAFNAKVITFTQRFNVAAHIAAVVSIGAGGSLCLVSDLSARTVLTIINVVFGVLFFGHTAAALSWDVLQLITKTFEFWFLFFTITLNALQWSLLFHDIRVAAFAWMGIMFKLTLCIDANVYTRHLAVRFFVLASPALFAAVVLTTARVPPDLDYRTYRILDIEMDAVDLLVNGNLVIAYFTAMDVFHSRKLVFSREPVQRIQCGMYFPVCQLVPQSRRVQPQRHLIPTTPLPVPVSLARQQLELCESTAAHGINATKMLLPQLARIAHHVLPTGVLNTLGFTSHIISILWVVLLGTIPGRDMGSYVSQPVVGFMTALGFACAAIFTVTYVGHYQRQLTRRVTRELDAWFVSFQVSIVTIGMCDLAAWEFHHVLPLVTMWIWCHWTVFFDAVPPMTRRQLAYTRRFGLLTSVVLVLYPIALARSLYISAYHFPERDRVLVYFKFGGVAWKVKLMGFLASKLFTLQVWMIRFLWREVLRPTDAFKTIKRRVFFLIPSS